MKILINLGGGFGVKYLPRAKPGTTVVQYIGHTRTLTRLPYLWPRHNPNVPDIIPQAAPRMTSWPDAPFILRPWAAENPPPPPVPLDIRGKIGQTVYQKTYRVLPDHTYSTTPELQRRRMVVPADPRVNAQMLLRARFGRAVQHWKTLTAQEHATYNARGRRMNPWIEGLNLWIREFARAHAPEEFQADADILKATGRLPPLT
jgi:hypothetical protein